VARGAVGGVGAAAAAAAVARAPPLLLLAAPPEEEAKGTTRNSIAAAHHHCRHQRHGPIGLAERAANTHPADRPGACLAPAAVALSGAGAGGHVP